MDELLKIKNRYFRMAMVWTIMLIIGIPLIVIGAIGLVNDQGILYILLLIVGLVGVGGGFYGCPLSWIAYSNKKRLYKLVNMIHGVESCTIHDLGDMLGREDAEVKEDVVECLKNGWLWGYALLDNGRITRTDRLDLHHAKCDFCGATFEFRGENSKCPYCGNWFSGTPLD